VIRTIQFDMVMPAKAGIQNKNKYVTRNHIYFVYIMASARNGTLYVGVTNDVGRRSFEHRNDLVEGFTKKYGVHRLVWFEEHGDIREAILREKRIKKWERAWKLRLIEESNPDWDDLSEKMRL